MPAYDIDTPYNILSLLAVLAVLYGLLTVTVYHNRLLAAWDIPIGTWLVSHATPATNRLFTLITDLGSYKFVRACALIACLLLLFTANLHWALIMLMLFAGSMLVMHFLKGIVPRERPNFPQNNLYGLDPSYPSGHTMLATAVYGMIGTLFFLYGHGTPLGWIGVILTIALILLIGFSRIYLGFHFLTDVIGGWLAGTMLFLAVWLVGNYLLMFLKV